MRQKRSVRRMSKENVNFGKDFGLPEVLFSRLWSSVVHAIKNSERNVLKEVNTVFAQLSKNIFLYASQSKMLNQTARKWGIRFGVSQVVAGETIEGAIKKSA